LTQNGAIISESIYPSVTYSYTLTLLRSNSQMCVNQRCLDVSSLNTTRCTSSCQTSEVST